MLKVFYYTEPEISQFEIFENFRKIFNCMYVTLMLLIRHVRKFKENLLKLI